jgi:DNA-binding XRE family transcriptional regulator
MFASVIKMCLQMLSNEHIMITKVNFRGGENMIVKPKIPDFINIRIKKGFTQRKLARETGLSSAFISHLEQEKRNIGPESASKICSVLGVEFDDIFIIDNVC